GKAARNTFRTNGPAISSCKGSAITKLRGILYSHAPRIWLQSPACTAPSIAPYSDIIITIVTTMQEDTQITFSSTESSGFTKKPNATPFAILDTKNQSQHVAKT